MTRPATSAATSACSSAVNVPVTLTNRAKDRSIATAVAAVTVVSDAAFEFATPFAFAPHAAAMIAATRIGTIAQNLIRNKTEGTNTMKLLRYERRSDHP